MRVICYKVEIKEDKYLNKVAKNILKLDSPGTVQVFTFSALDRISNQTSHIELPHVMVLLSASDDILDETIADYYTQIFNQSPKQISKIDLYSGSEIQKEPLYKEIDS